MKTLFFIFILFATLVTYSQPFGNDTTQISKYLELAHNNPDSSYYYINQGLKMAKKTHSTQDDLLIYNLLENKKRLSYLSILSLLEKEKEEKLLFSNLFLLALIIIAFISVLLFNMNRHKENLIKTGEAREQFFSIVAHDLRAPMASLYGLGQVANYLLKTKQYDRLQNISYHIDEMSIKITSLLDNLIQWGKTKQINAPYSPKEFSLNKHLHDIIDIYQQIARIRHIQLEIKEDTNVMVYADPDGVSLIVRNLIDNALKSTPKDGTIVIETKVSLDKAPLLEISNSGHGIKKGMLVYIQNIFRGSKKGSIGNKGLGMGLLLIKQFVVQNHGKIWVESTEDKWTTFSVELPKSI